MEIRQYTYVDVYYNEGEEEKAKKERKRLEKLGFELQVEDDADDKFTYCDQYLRFKRPFKVK